MAIFPSWLPLHTGPSYLVAQRVWASVLAAAEPALRSANMVRPSGAAEFHGSALKGEPQAFIYKWSLRCLILPVSL